MAELYNGRVVHMHIAGGSGLGSGRMLAHLLDNTEGVVTYYVDAPSRTLTAYLDETHADDDALVRALVTSGMYPVATSDFGVTCKDEPNA